MPGVVVKVRDKASGGLVRRLDPVWEKTDWNNRPS